MKKIIVTGGSGFIGSNLVKFLLNKNYFVINIDKLSYSANPYNLKELKGIKNYKFFKQDINNRNEILKLLNRFKPVGTDQTHWTTHNEFQFTSLSMKLMGFFMKKAFPKQTMQYMQQFKSFAEKE